MNILHFFSFVIFSFASSVQSKSRCPTTYCGGNTTSLPLRYPFKLRGQKPLNDCINYTDLRCSSADESVPVLTLPFSGDFYVREIYYEHSAIQLYDPQNCLPKRLMMDLNLSSTPFYSKYDRNYTLYGCPPEAVSLANLTTVDCLSNASSSAVEANDGVSREVMEVLYGCRVIFSSIVPIHETDFILGWYVDSCKTCPTEIGSMVPIDVWVVTYAMVSFTVLIMPAIIFIGCCAHFVKLFKKEVVLTRSNAT